MGGGLWREREELRMEELPLITVKESNWVRKYVIVLLFRNNGSILLLPFETSGFWVFELCSSKIIKPNL